MEKDRRKREKIIARIERADYEMAQGNFSFQRNEKEEDLHVKKCLYHYSENHKTYPNTTHTRYLWKIKKIQQRSKCWQELYRPRQS
jgi:hypothetical protein